MDREVVDDVATWLRVMEPFTLDLDETQQAEYARAADRLDEKRSNAVSVAGRRFRVTRVERLVRTGPDGPEGPRPSDLDPQPPVDVQVKELKAQGLWKEEDEPIELDDSALRLKRLWEQEETRRAASKQSNNRDKGT